MAALVLDAYVAGISIYAACNFERVLTTPKQQEQSIDGRLPFLQIEFGLGKFVELPRLPTASIPIDFRVAEGDEPERKIAAIEAFRIPANSDNGLVHLPSGKPVHHYAQILLRRVGEAPP